MTTDAELFEEIWEETIATEKPNYIFEARLCGLHPYGLRFNPSFLPLIMIEIFLEECDKNNEVRSGRKYL